jgi:hypothetical protein
VPNKANPRAQLNPNRWDSTQRWMKFDIVTQWVTAHSEKTMYLSAGLALAVGRMDLAVNLIAELAPALSGKTCGSPT